MQPPQHIIEDRHLGDGVYASFDGYQIVLDLRAHDSTTKIALDPIVFNALLRFMDAVDVVRGTIIQGQDIKAKPDTDEKGT